MAAARHDVAHVMGMRPTPFHETVSKKPRPPPSCRRVSSDHNSIIVNLALPPGCAPYERYEIAYRQSLLADPAWVTIPTRFRVARCTIGMLRPNCTYRFRARGYGTERLGFPGQWSKWGSESEGIITLTQSLANSDESAMCTVM